MRFSSSNRNIIKKKEMGCFSSTLTWNLSVNPRHLSLWFSYVKGGRDAEGGCILVLGLCSINLKGNPLQSRWYLRWVLFCYLTLFFFFMPRFIERNRSDVGMYFAVCDIDLVIIDLMLACTSELWTLWTQHCKPSESVSQIKLTLTITFFVYYQ